MRTSASCPLCVTRTCRKCRHSILLYLWALAWQSYLIFHHLLSCFCYVYLLYSSMLQETNLTSSEHFWHQLDFSYILQVSLFAFFRFCVCTVDVCNAKRIPDSPQPSGLKLLCIWRWPDVWSVIESALQRLKNLPPTPFCPFIAHPFRLSFSQMRASKCVTDPVYSQPYSRHLSPWASLSFATVALMACQLWVLTSTVHAQ